jgi:hypothetical protein
MICQRIAQKQTRLYGASGDAESLQAASALGPPEFVLWPRRFESLVEGGIGVPRKSPQVCPQVNIGDPGLQMLSWQK